MSAPSCCRTFLTILLLGAALAGASGESTRTTFSDRIVFNRNQDIYLLKDDGTLFRLTDTGDNGLPVVSPDGYMIAFSSKRDGDSEIFLINSDGGGLWQLTNNDAEDASPTWSPDSRWIAYSSNRDGNFEIYVTDVYGRNPRRLTRDPADDLTPAWSPDGCLIAFVSERDGPREIYLMDPDGDQVRRLTEDRSNNCTPKWSTDGTEIIFFSTDAGSWRSVICVLETDGADQRQLLHGAGRRATDGP
ncbi:PD40 domain-containing protein [bacterium]|nr:PD40 domain-containing protein [bacterium]